LLGFKFISSNFLTDVEHSLRRDLRRTKALLQDAQLMLQKNREAAGSRTTVKQLRNQVPAHTGKLYFFLEIIVIVIIVVSLFSIVGGIA